MRNDILLRRGILKDTSIQYLEYIESTGTQIILTDYYPNPKTKIVACIQLKENGNSLKGSSSNNSFIGASNGQGYLFSFNHGSDDNNVSNATSFFIWNDKSTSTGGRVISTKPYGIDNITKKGILIFGPNNFNFLDQNITLDKKTSTQELPMAIFGRNVKGDLVPYNRFNLKVYSFQIYEDGKLLLDLKPFQDGNNNGLIDIINNKKYISNIPFATSDQIINNNYIIIKNSYYIDQTPIQYIDTGIVVEDTDDIFIDVEFFEEQTNKNSGTNVLAFGWALGAWNEAPQCLLRDNYNQSTNKYSLWYGSTDYTASSNIPRCKVLISPQNKICQLNGINVSNINFTNAYPNGNSNITPYIGTTHWKKSGVGKQGADCKVYEYYVKDKNGNYKIHLKPKLINGRACMYDSVSGREFYDENGRDFGYFIDGKLKE